ncbi:ATP-binding protein [Pedobacter sp. SYP-B3415]|uniref:Dph6-related ATP pyrophosphatase n=1 Tax=Pedobacter sp. SYP-B3415 TaxID=2496641 RepID=UPI00101D517A|nr:ATP-binding protein [Pedobacter sp. SYP-B3415]
MVRTKAVFNWSGGKDSALALNRVLEAGDIEVVYLLTTVNADHGRVSMHGVREEMLDLQAAATGIPLYKIYVPENQTMSAYAESMRGHWAVLKNQGIYHSVFGDIHLQDLRDYREKQLAAYGVTCSFPIWAEDTKVLLDEFRRKNFGALLCCVLENQRPALGREVGPELIKLLLPGTDPCGENGEYHSFVYRAPFFLDKITFKRGDVVFRSFGFKTSSDINETHGYWYLDLLPMSTTEDAEVPV